MSFRPRSASRIIEGVEAGAGHHGEVLAVHHAEVERPASAVEADLHGLLDRGGDAEVGGQQVGRAGGQDRHVDRLAGDGVEAALHRAVAAPDEDEVGALAHGLLHRGRRLPALRDLEPQRLDALVGEDGAQLVEAAAHRLLGVAHHGDGGHRPTSSVSASRRGEPRRPGGHGGGAEGQRPEQQPGHHVGGEVHAPVHPGEGDGQHGHGRHRPGRGSATASATGPRRAARRCRTTARRWRPRGPTGSCGCRAGRRAGRRRAGRGRRRS